MHQEDEDAMLIKEHALTVIVNERPILKLVCTRSNLRELVIGRLVTEGIIETLEDIYKIYFCKYENEARVFATLKKDSEEKMLPKVNWEADWIFRLAAEFEKGTVIHKMTHGCHSCILAKGENILFTCEDIGRHNAVDKAVGYAFLNHISLRECILFTSGRVPVDMVEKVVAAGIPALVSKSVPTVESVKLAKKVGLTLICRAWSDRFEIYAP